MLMSFFLFLFVNSFFFKYIILFNIFLIFSLLLLLLLLLLLSLVLIKYTGSCLPLCFPFLHSPLKHHCIIYSFLHKINMVSAWSGACTAFRYEEGDVKYSRIGGLWARPGNHLKLKKISETQRGGAFRIPLTPPSPLVHPHGCLSFLVQKSLMDCWILTFGDEWSKQKTLIRCWKNVGPPSGTLEQYRPTIGSMSHIFAGKVLTQQIRYTEPMLV